MDRSSGTTGERDRGIDGSRFVAIAAVVLAHACATWLSAEVGTAATRSMVLAIDLAVHWGAPFFFVLSGYLTGVSISFSASPAAWLRARVVRIGVPYVAWSVIYLAFGSALAVAAGEGIPAWNPVIVVFAAGASSTLWFLVALLVANVLLALPWPDRLRGPALVAIGLLIDYLVHWGPLSWAARVPLVDRIGLAIVTFAIGFLFARAGLSARKGWPWFIAAAACMVLDVYLTTSGVEWLGAPFVRHGLEHVAAWLLLVPVASGLSPRWVEAVAPWGRLAMGVFVMHTAVLVLIALAFPPRADGALQWVASAFVGATMVSGFAAALLLRMPLLRRLVS